MGSYYRNVPAINQEPINQEPRIYFLDGQAWADCIDGVRLMLTRLETDQGILTDSGFQKLFGTELRPGLPSSTEDTK